MELTDLVMWVLIPWGVVLFIAVIVLLLRLRWKITTVILRYTGDNRRPVVITTKARKIQRFGITELEVKGYKEHLRDFKAENYYPGRRGVWGALILFEFEDGWLTPLKPSWRKLTVEQRADIEVAINKINGLRDVKFDYDKAIHDQLKLEIVDDVDAEFFMLQRERQNRQYMTTWERLEKLAVPVLLALLIIAGLLGWLVWVKEDPTNAAKACVLGMQENNRNLLLTMAQNASSLVPPG